MFPVILELGPLKLYSFGLMAAIALIAGSYLLRLEMDRRRMGEGLWNNYSIAALVGGFLGAKINFLVVHPDLVRNDFTGTLFSGAGLVWYGGFIGGVVACYLLSRRYHHDFGELSDAFAPALSAAYLFGRFGCLFSGDGDYGPPSDLPWAMAFPKGIVPTDVPVHPTPIYEILMTAIVLALLWATRRQPWARWSHFGLYLLLSGVERFLAEIWRTNPRGLFGLTTAQIISVLIFVIGLGLFLTRTSRKSPAESSAAAG
ncbi:MAG: prolipoprotein diacylglyceryl transferase [Candidatus Eisenbacteria bacterium]